MGYYFTKVDEYLLGALRAEDKTVYVWTGDNAQPIARKFSELDIKTGSGEYDDLFGYQPITYILTKTDVLSSVPTINNGSSYQLKTYIIPEGYRFNVNKGPNKNRIVCFSKTDYDKIAAAAK